MEKALLYTSAIALISTQAMADNQGYSGKVGIDYSYSTYSSTSSDETANLSLSTLWGIGQYDADLYTLAVDFTAANLEDANNTSSNLALGTLTAQVLVILAGVKTGIYYGIVGSPDSDVTNTRYGVSSHYSEGWLDINFRYGKLDELTEFKTSTSININSQLSILGNIEYRGDLDNDYLQILGGPGVQYTFNDNIEAKLQYDIGQTSFGNNVEANTNRISFGVSYSFGEAKQNEVSPIGLTY